MRQIRLCVFEVPYDEGPLASVRYTRYGKDGRAKEVREVDYWTEEELDAHVCFAISHDVDATIYTSHDIGMFPNIADLTGLQ